MAISEGRLDELRNKTKQAKRELGKLGSAKVSPEIIESTNLLRENERLHQLDQKKSELINDYEEYINELESTLSLVFSIQNDLISLVREQTKIVKKPMRRTKK